MAHFKDELGNMHGKLTVIARFPKNTAKKQAQWVCRCECGNLTVKHSQELRGGTRTFLWLLFENFKERHYWVKVWKVDSDSLYW